MSDDAGGPGSASVPTGGGGGGHHGGSGGLGAIAEAPTINTKPKEVNIDVPEDEFPHTPVGTTTPNPFSRRATSIDLDDYFSGPRDLTKHSKWPLFMQMHGSILPKLIIPILVVGAWATLVTVLTKNENIPNVDLGIPSTLLTVTGFVVGLGLSFRSSTAYERYAEGRRYWAQLILTCHSLSRTYWINTKVHEERSKEELLEKLTAMNLLVAFAVSLKHKLRFEPYSYYRDLKDLVEHLDTFAEQATQERLDLIKKRGFFKTVGESLGLSFATSNPRKDLKRATSPLGNLPLEILCHLTSYTDYLIESGQLNAPAHLTTAFNGLQALNDVMVGTDRVLNTPLPIAYAIAIQQITWLYIVLLPFQLLDGLDWVTIPATIAAAAIILSILFIGREIENPFGNDVNDLPLEEFCQQIVSDMETIAAQPRRNFRAVVEHPKNKVLFPHSNSTYPIWAQRPEAAIRRTLRNRPHNQFGGATDCIADDAEQKGGSVNTDKENDNRV